MERETSQVSHSFIRTFSPLFWQNTHWSTRQDLCKKMLLLLIWCDVVRLTNGAQKAPSSTIFNWSNLGVLFHRLLTIFACLLTTLRFHLIHLIGLWISAVGGMSAQMCVYLLNLIKSTWKQIGGTSETHTCHIKRAIYTAQLTRDLSLSLSVPLLLQWPKLSHLFRRYPNYLWIIIIICLLPLLSALSDMSDKTNSQPDSRPRHSGPRAAE